MLPFAINHLTDFHICQCLPGTYFLHNLLGVNKNNLFIPIIHHYFTFIQSCGVSRFYDHMSFCKARYMCHNYDSFVWSTVHPSDTLMDYVKTQSDSEVSEPQGSWGQTWSKKVHPVLTSFLRKNSDCPIEFGHPIFDFLQDRRRKLVIKILN